MVYDLDFFERISMVYDQRQIGEIRVRIGYFKPIFETFRIISSLESIDQPSILYPLSIIQL